MFGTLLRSRRGAGSAGCDGTDGAEVPRGREVLRLDVDDEPSGGGGIGGLTPERVELRVCRVVGAGRRVRTPGRRPGGLGEGG